MFINVSDLNLAIRKVEEETQKRVNKELAYSFICKIKDKLESGIPLPETFRPSLNEMYMRSKETRQLYCKVAAKYFGKHGGLKAARMRKAKIPPRKKSPPSSRKIEVRLDPSGQLRWGF
ncbi:hypothetical protein HY249_02895 [Candidatus Azambacteria bacterium]|nr:hypothetical protein [Candidatus Azambacteria bacterium]